MKKEKILIILPTKQRLNDFETFAESWMTTTKGKSDVLVAIDLEDKTYDTVKEKYPFIYEKVEPSSVLEILNQMAVKYSKEYKFISFMEDDCVFVTENWEDSFINKLNEIGDYGIVWGNDLINRHQIVGLPFLDSKIVDVLGYMSPPELKYLWVDYFWKQLGADLGTLFYFPEIIVEHRHYSSGKRQKDEISDVVDSHGLIDMKSYHENYLKNRYRSDLQKLINQRQRNS
jgi:hypothetical protein